MRQYGIDVVCIERGCRAGFHMTPEDLEWYRARGLSMPKRCERHRAARRPIRGGLYHVLGGEHQRGADTIRLYTKHKET